MLIDINGKPFGKNDIVVVEDDSDSGSKRGTIIKISKLSDSIAYAMYGTSTSMEYSYLPSKLRCATGLEKLTFRKEEKTGKVIAKSRHKKYKPNSAHIKASDTSITPTVDIGNTNTKSKIVYDENGCMFINGLEFDPRDHIIGRDDEQDEAYIMTGSFYGFIAGEDYVMLAPWSEFHHQAPGLRGTVIEHHTGEHHTEGEIWWAVEWTNGKRYDYRAGIDLLIYHSDYIPIREIAPPYCNNIKTGYLLEEGDPVYINTHSKHFEIISTVYGEVQSHDFNEDDSDMIKTYPVKFYDTKIGGNVIYELRCGIDISVEEDCFFSGLNVHGEYFIPKIPQHIQNILFTAIKEHKEKEEQKI